MELINKLRNIAPQGMDAIQKAFSESARLAAIEARRAKMKGKGEAAPAGGVKDKVRRKSPEHRERLDSARGEEKKAWQEQRKKSSELFKNPEAQKLRDDADHKREVHYGLELIQDSNKKHGIEDKKHDKKVEAAGKASDEAEAKWGDHPAYKASDEASMRASDATNRRRAIARGKV